MLIDSRLSFIMVVVSLIEWNVVSSSIIVSLSMNVIISGRWLLSWLVKLVLCVVLLVISMFGLSLWCSLCMIVVLLLEFVFGSGIEMMFVLCVLLIDIVLWLLVILCVLILSFFSLLCERFLVISCVFFGELGNVCWIVVCVRIIGRLGGSLSAFVVFMLKLMKVSVLSSVMVMSSEKVGKCVMV